VGVRLQSAVAGSESQIARWWSRASCVETDYLDSPDGHVSRVCGRRTFQREAPEAGRVTIERALEAVLECPFLITRRTRCERLRMIIGSVPRRKAWNSLPASTTQRIRQFVQPMDQDPSKKPSVLVARACQ
jgi:hypothetical protein